jgi:hypothetical protein
VFSVGTAIGSLLCEKLSHRTVEIGLVPLGAIGVTACGFWLYFARTGLAAGDRLERAAVLAGPRAAGRCWRR